MRETATITVATLLMGGVALEQGLPASQPAICRPQPTVVQFVPVPEPSVIAPATNIALPPMTLSLWPSDEPKTVAIKEDTGSDETAEDRGPETKHSHRKWRHHRRRR